jgi:hypothetical protein
LVLRYTLLLSLSITTPSVPLTGTDLDRDGIDEEDESMLARAFLPMLWYDDSEGCAEPGVIFYHLRPYVPGGSTDTLALTYAVSYYDDCGMNGHDFDFEVFALTLYPVENSPTNFGAHALATWAHDGTLCEISESRTYDPPVIVDVPVSDTLYAAWEEIFASVDKHGNFLDPMTCRGHCLIDWCDADYLMNNGRLVFPEEGQFLDLYNIGEINDPILDDISEINEPGGYTFDARRIWDTPWMVERFYRTAPGPDVPVDFSISTPPYPNPLRRCRDLSIGIDLWYRSLLRIRITNSRGQTLNDGFPGELCWGGGDIRLQAWDGRDVYGSCPASGRYFVELTAYRDGSAAQRIVPFDVTGDPIDPPAGPTGLELALEDDHVRLCLRLSRGRSRSHRDRHRLVRGSRHRSGQRVCLPRLCLG